MSVAYCLNIMLFLTVTQHQSKDLTWLDNLFHGDIVSPSTSISIDTINDFESAVNTYLKKPLQADEVTLFQKIEKSEIWKRDTDIADVLEEAYFDYLFRSIDTEPSEREYELKWEPILKTFLKIQSDREKFNLTYHLFNRKIKLLAEKPKFKWIEHFIKILSKQSLNP